MDIAKLRAAGGSYEILDMREDAEEVAIRIRGDVFALEPLTDAVRAREPIDFAIELPSGKVFPFVRGIVDGFANAGMTGIVETIDMHILTINH